MAVLKNTANYPLTWDKRTSLNWGNLNWRKYDIDYVHWNLRNWTLHVQRTFNPRTVKDAESESTINI